jgi:putative iron-regulated protein
MISFRDGRKALIGAVAGIMLVGPASAAPTAKDVISNYADVAHATFEDALSAAHSLQEAISALVAKPTPNNLRAAKGAWLASRKPYQQSEAYRFGNAMVDDWEGKVNAWPLDEGLIDYVSGGYGTKSDENPLYTANVIAGKSIKINGKTVNVSKITKKLLSETLHEAGGVEANVATGYHAIEFLLWGQDKNGTSIGAGQRKATDFSTKNCTNGNCARRGEYLKVVTALMIDDLGDAVAMWAKDGKARAHLMKDPAGVGLTAIMTGMGSLSYGELAGERMKLGLMVHDPEEEHDCFSDNTHNSHLYDAMSIRNVYVGRYRRLDGSIVTGPSISDLVRAKDAGVDDALRGKLNDTLKAMQSMVRRAETVESYDQMIGEGNKDGNATVQTAIDGLLAQTKAIERAVAVLALKPIGFEGSDSLDAPAKVGK